jgi:hypothetical protein
VPALAASAWRGWRARAGAPAFVAAMGLGMWLPWGLANHPTTFMAYMLEAVPFAAIATAGLLHAVPRPAARRVAMGAYALAAGAWLVAYHPLLTARPVSVERYVASTWLPGWEALAVLREFRATHGLLAPEAYRAYARGLGNQRWGLVGGPDDGRAPVKVPGSPSARPAPARP